MSLFLQSLKFGQKLDQSGFHLYPWAKGGSPLLPRAAQARPTLCHSWGRASPLLGDRPSLLSSFLKAHLGLGRMVGTEQLFALTLSHHLTGF